MNGMFDVKLINNRGKKDGYFEQAIQDGYIMDALDDLPAVRHLPKQQNWIFDNYAGGMIRNILSGPAHTGLWENLYSETAQNASLAFIMLTTTSTLPTYQEDFTCTDGGNYAIHTTNRDPDSANTSSGSKRFIEDQITSPTIWTDSVRETISFRNRWLWLPSQGNSNAIRSISIHGCEDGDATSGYMASGRIGRVRLRDSAGLVTTLNKTSSNSLLIEYTFSLVAY